MDSSKIDMNRRIEKIKELCRKINVIEEMIDAGDLLSSILPDYKNELDWLNAELSRMVNN
jgi:hypothetical protein